MDRYKYNNVIQQPNSFRYRSSTRYPAIPLSMNDSYIITQYGDRLDNLAYQFYKDVTLWWLIAAANPDLPKDSLYPPLGYQLRIPIFSLDLIRELENINS
jgi:hypothetical protein